MLLKTARIKVDNLAQEVQRLHHQVEVENEASQRSLQTQLVALQFDVKTLNERLQFLDKEYKKKLNLYKEGLIILNIVQDSRGKYRRQKSH